MPKYEITAEQHRILDNVFTYHAPQDDQIERYMHIRNYGKSFAEFIIAHSPVSSEQAEAIRKIEEAVFWTNAAIARHEKDK